MGKKNVPVSYSLPITLLKKIEAEKVNRFHTDGKIGSASKIVAEILEKHFEEKKDH